MQLKTTLIIILLALAFQNISAETRTIKIIVRSNNVPPGSEIHIIGQNNELGGWLRPVHMEKISSSQWCKQVSIKKGDTLTFKFHRGSWRSEAVDSNGTEFYHFTYVVKNDTTLNYYIPQWRDQLKNRIIITSERLKNKSGYIELYEGWRYKLGDDSLWADTNYDDTSWESVYDPLMDKDDFQKIKGNWTGNIWYRNKIIVDSNLINKPLGIVFFSSGASEIYLDGKLLYQFGKIGSSKQTEFSYFDRNPRSILFSKTEHVLAVRYSNYSAIEHIEHNAPVGFAAMIGDQNTLIKDRVNTNRELSIHQMAFGAFVLAFALIHLLLFIFYPKAKENLFYSIAMLAFAIVVYSGTQTYFTNSMSSAINFTVMNSAAIQMALIFGLLTVYASSYKHFPKQHLIFIGISSLFLLHTILLPQDFMQPYVDYAFYAFAIITTIEIFRVEIKSILNKESHGWNWLVGLGVIIAILFITYQLLINYGIVPPLFGVNLVYVYGIVILAVTMSVNLSQRISHTNKNLALQLEQVRELSQKTLEQERRAKDEEIARKLLEIDNNRKTKELEEARKLQFAMLPKKVPPLPEFDIAVYMKPATEVGGDYYDFRYDKKGDLIIAVGDATGHGMRAGTLVATIKGLFTAESLQTDILSFLNKCNLIIRDMQLGNLFMAMMVARITSNSSIHMSLSSAGMPPALIYRDKEKDVEEHRILGLPLGGSSPVLGGHYTKKDLELSKGDIVLLMSDGFPELFNKEKEILDYDQAKSIFCRIASNSTSSQGIIDELLLEANKWMNGADQQDDITFVVIRVK